MSVRRSSQNAPAVGLLVVLSFGSLTRASFAANQAEAPVSAPQIVSSIDESKLVTLVGNTHPFAVPTYDQGALPDGFAMDHMLLQLKRSPEREQALQSALRQLQDPHSANYHKWLTADELGKNFGPSGQDINAVVGWLTSHGLKVNQVYKNGLTIDVSGTAGQMRDIFHTEMHQYNVKGEQHIANSSDPQIPAAMASVVAGFASLHDFMPKSQMTRPKSNFSFPCTGCPDGFNNAEQYDEAPADFATIYNVTPLYKAKTPITGRGQVVVVLEDTNVNPADVAKFRSSFGLSSYAGKFIQIHPGPGCDSPGLNAAEGEAALDAEWAGAVAPDALVALASCADTPHQFRRLHCRSESPGQQNPSAHHEPQLRAMRGYERTEWQCLR